MSDSKDSSDIEVCGIASEKEFLQMSRHYMRLTMHNPTRPGCGEINYKKTSLESAGFYLWDIDEGDFSLYANIDGQAIPLTEMKNPIETAREIVEVIRIAPELAKENLYLRSRLDDYKELVEKLNKAVEFAEYMAKSVSKLQLAANALAEARDEENESLENVDIEDAENSYRDAWSSLSLSVYDFRKRAPKVQGSENG